MGQPFHGGFPASARKSAVPPLDKSRCGTILIVVPAHTTPSAIGSCTLWWEADKITRFMLLTDVADSVAPPDGLRPLIERVQTHLRGQPEDFSDVPYDWSRATDFQRRVYEAALLTKSGFTATYGDLAKAIGEAPAVSRAVGTALGLNPWPLLVPCHRFVGANGKMTGFSAPGGINTKLQLLAIEGNQMFPV